MKIEARQKIRKWALPLVAAVCATSLQSCDKDDDYDIRQAPRELVEAFNAKFPGVDGQCVEWEWNGRMNAYEADFWQDRYEKSAWFSKSYEWLMTETDYNPPFSEVPQAVIDAAETQNPDYRIEDIDYIETPQENYYNVEMERNDRDIYVDIYADGTLR